MAEATSAGQNGGDQKKDNAQPTRRTFLSVLSLIAMALGLISGYGMFAYLAGRFLFPAHGIRKSWMFVVELSGIGKNDSLVYRTPAGQTVSIARLSENGTADDFIALSSVCPHLGCQVHWESDNNRFFCPCHNGAFDDEGTAITGPPAEAKQSLAKYPLMVENGLLFIEAPTDSIG